MSYWINAMQTAEYLDKLMYVGRKLDKEKNWHAAFEYMVVSKSLLNQTRFAV